MYLFLVDCRSVAVELHFDYPITSREQIAPVATSCSERDATGRASLRSWGGGPLYTREMPFVHDLAADRQMLVWLEIDSASGMDGRWW